MPSPAIIGHRAQLAQLESDLSSGNLSHAYLFVGPPGIGKFTVTKWFAKKIMTKDAPPSEHERIEEQMDRLIHPDVLVLDQLWMDDVCDDFDVIAQSSNIPQQHRAKAKVKTDVIGIDDVRVLQERLNETGTSGHRLCLIKSVERMRDEAANAFLKTLEEPHPGTVFLLTAESEEIVLPTIRSRSRVVAFQRVGEQEIQSLLSGVDATDARFILHIAQGAPGLAVRLRDDPDALAHEKQVHDQARNVWVARSLADRLQLLTPLHERGKEAEQFLRHLAITLRESPNRSRSGEAALTALIRERETNAHRQLMVQKFALDIDNK